VSRLLRVGGLLLALAAVGVVGAQGAARVWHLRGEVVRLEREIAELRAETDRLNAAVHRLRTDPETIEQVARESLGLVKPGERVLKLPPSAPGR
jgi:cell division protein FtsB